MRLKEVSGQSPVRVKKERSQSQVKDKKGHKEVLYDSGKKNKDRC